MSNLNDAKKALKALGAYADEVTEAYRLQRFGDDEKSQTALAALKKHRLTTQLDDQSPPRLRNVVNRLLNHSLGRSRQQHADATIAGLWQDLTNLFEQYHDANRLGAYEDALNTELIIQETLSELIEEIDNVTRQFSFFVSLEFSQVSHLSLRIKLNKQAIEQAKKLTQVLESLQLEERSSYIRNNAFLSDLLLRHLPRELEIAGKTLSHSMRTLIERMAKLQKEQRTQKLIMRFNQHYQQYPDYTPAIAITATEKVPGCFRRSHVSVAPACANVATEDLLQRTALSEVVQRLQHRQRDNSNDKAKEVVNIAFEDPAPAPIVISPTDAFIGEIIAAMVKRKGQWLASQFYPYAPENIARADYLLLLASRIGNLPKALNQFKLTFIGTQVPSAPNTCLSHDFKITWIGS